VLRRKDNWKFTRNYIVKSELYILHTSCIIPMWGLKPTERWDKSGPSAAKTIESCRRQFRPDFEASRDTHGRLSHGWTAVCHWPLCHWIETGMFSIRVSLNDSNRTHSMTMSAVESKQHLHTYLHTYLVITYTYIVIGGCVCKHFFIYINAYICPYIHTYICTWIHTYMHIYVNTYCSGGVVQWYCLRLKG
jgi:hypothetical protein